MQKGNEYNLPAALSSFSRRALLVLVCTAVGVAACTGVLGPRAASEPEYHVTSSRPSAQVAVSNEGDSAIVEVYSDNGIGNASVKLVSGTWPGSIVMRFHLQGLESLQFLYDETVVNVSVNTQNMILQSVSVDGAAEEAVNDQSDYWMGVTFVDKDGTVVDSPVAGGVIEVQAPADFLAGEYTEFTINWIDFYR
jgi:hypothetical protein